jgi:AraC-like DNA-binding protein
LQGSDIQVYAEGAPVDCRCAPNTAWYALQVRRKDLQAASLAVNGLELALPTSGLQNLHLPRCQAVFFRAVLQEGLQMGFALNGSTDGRVTSRIAQRLISAAARALFAATGCCDGRTERAVRRRLQVLRAAEDFVQRRLGDAVTMQDMAAAAATSERSLEYLFGDAYGVSPHTWLLLARLHRVRHELLTTDGSVSVRRAALKWGLPHGGRFAARYRELFGEFPRETAARRS